MANWKDKNDILGEFGVEMVCNILKHRNEAKWNNYRVEAVRNPDIQKREIDIIEEWTDGAGEKHSKAHEVKTERPTLGREAVYNKGRVDKAKKINDKWAPYSGACKGSSALRPTGNFFIEFVQDIPALESEKIKNELLAYTPCAKLPDGAERYKGWFVVLEESAEYIEKNFTDGRDVWFIAYMGEPKNEKERKEKAEEDIRWFKEKEIQEGERKSQCVKDVTTGHSVLFQTPEENLMAFMLFPSTCQEYEVKDTDRPGKKSWGFLLPIEELFRKPVILENVEELGGIDVPVAGVTDPDTGVTVYINVYPL